ncbi:MAG: hypothetical protein SFT81_02620 [Candidatus Caenarcaniphilales bacterium]|nr:hypothetical protein [Candidatus Caenarcaniphilales bacterium]
MSTPLFLTDDELPKNCPEEDVAYYRRIRDRVYPRFDVEVKA